MKYVCILLGFLTGKWKVKCTECSNLDANNKCFGHEMPADVIGKTISCGFWKKK